MRIFLFKILFRLAWWVAPDTKRVNKIFEMYLDWVKREEDFEECQRRQAEMDACVQPRTETYEFLTTKKQRDLYGRLMPPRISDQDQPRSHYSDYEDTKRYHEGS